MMLVSLILIGCIIFLLVNKNSDEASKVTQKLEALEIAKMRLASGEITIEEYELIKKSIL